MTKKDWKMEELWVSVLGALVDVEAGVASPDKALGWIKDYLDKYINDDNDL